MGTSKKKTKEIDFSESQKVRMDELKKASDILTANTQSTFIPRDKKEMIKRGFDNPSETTQDMFTPRRQNDDKSQSEQPKHKKKIKIRRRLPLSEALEEQYEKTMTVMKHKIEGRDRNSIKLEKKLLKEHAKLEKDMIKNQMVLEKLMDSPEMVNENHIAKSMEVQNNYVNAMQEISGNIEKIVPKMTADEEWREHRRKIYQDSLKATTERTQKLFEERRKQMASMRVSADNVNNNRTPSYSHYNPAGNQPLHGYAEKNNPILQRLQEVNEHGGISDTLEFNEPVEDRFAEQKRLSDRSNIRSGRYQFAPEPKKYSLRAVGKHEKEREEQRKRELEEQGNEPVYSDDIIDVHD